MYKIKDSNYSPYAEVTFKHENVNIKFGLLGIEELQALKDELTQTIEELGGCIERTRNEEEAQILRRKESP